jgi:site-specific DNA-methyltransferase (adenine-specific)
MQPVILGDATLYHGDCLEILPTLGKVDAVITDPPYKTSSTPGGCTDTDVGRKWSGMIKACDVSVGIHQINFTDWMKMLNHDGDYYFFCNDKNIYPLLHTALEHKFRLHNMLVWHKPNATPNRWYMKNAEFIAYLWKGNAQPIKNMGDKQVIHTEHEGNKSHPTQKPIALMKYIIKNTTGVVLDPFMGSGTTGVACMNLGRKFIGIEIDERYFQIACERIERAQQQLKLF